MQRDAYGYLRMLLFTAALLAGCAGSAATPTTTAPLPAEPAVATSAASPQPMVEPTVFRILAQESQARFQIDEILGGSPNTVVGVTDQVSGEIRIQPSAPAQSELGPIQIDAGSLSTDNSFRNGAIDSFILQTAAFPFIIFTSTTIDGLPTSVSPGDNLSFTVRGDLTIRDVTLPVTFDVTVAVASPTRLTGLARATITRSDFGLTIPSVPQVADVSDAIVLEFAFAAQAS